MSRFLTAVRLRLPVLAALFLIAATLFYGYTRHGDAPSAWKQLKVVLLPTGPFEDLQTITYSIDCRQAGLDPYEARCDPARRPLNYPPVWLELGHLGVNGAHSGALGWVFAAMAATAYLLSLVSRTPFSAVSAFVAVFFSRPLVLAMERGNTDQVILFLLVVACWFVPRLSSRTQGWFVAATAILLACLKVYPAVTAIASLKQRRGWWLVPGTAIASAIALELTAGRHLKQVLQGTPAMVSGSFGVIPLLSVFGGVAHRGAAPWVEGHRIEDGLIALTLFLAFAAIGLVSRSWIERSLPALGTPSFRGTLAVGCAAIYCFAFVGGASFNYRLIFLTGVLALLLEAHDRGLTSVRPFVVLLLLYFAIPGRFVAVHEVCDLMVFGMLSAWMAVFVASRLKRGFSRASPH